MEANLETDLHSEKANVAYQQERLLKRIEELTISCGWSQRPHVLNTKVLKLLSNYSCENRIMQTLISKEPEVNARFDFYYREKSEFATVKILDRIKTMLSASGIEATIQTEVPSCVGRSDAVVALRNPSIASPGKNQRIRIEIKASSGIDFEQIGRYLLEPSPLILVRIATGQVAKLSVSDLQSYTTFILQEFIAKVERLLSQKCYVVPGIDCNGCLDAKCVYNKNEGKARRNKKIITVPDTEFSDDISSFFKNLSYVAERTGMIVVEELQGFVRPQNQDFAIPSKARRQ